MSTWEIAFTLGGALTVAAVLLWVFDRYDTREDRP